MPRWDVSDRHELTVEAAADRTYEAVRSVDLAASPVARLLFAIRGLPHIGRIGQLGPISGRRQRVRRSVTLDAAFRAGFVLLAEEPSREIVIGVVGLFWAPSGGRLRIGAEAFAGHAAPGTAKAALSFRVDPVGPDRSRVVTETRIICADGAARRSFVRYWRLIRPGSALIRRIALARIKRAAESATPR